MTLFVNRAEIIERRSAVVERGAPHGETFLNRVADRLTRAGIDDIATARVGLRLGGWLSPERDVLIVTHRAFPDLRVYVSAETIGVHLELLQLVALQPNVFKRALAGWLTRGAWWAWSVPKGIGTEERCSVFLTLVGSAVDEVARSIIRRRGRNSAFDRRSTDVFDEWQ